MNIYADDNTVLVEKNRHNLITVNGLFYNGETSLEQVKERYLNNRGKQIENMKQHAIDYPNQKEYWDNQITLLANAEYVIMTWKEYLDIERRKYLEKPLKTITEGLYEEMLNVLPPETYVTINGVTEFTMSEHYSGVYTTQYATYKGKYYSKMVDSTDTKTWIHNFIEREA